ATAGDRVVAVTAEQRIVPSAAVDGVVALAAIQREQHGCGKRRGIDLVVAGQAPDIKEITGLGRGEGDLRCKAGGRDDTARLGQTDGVVGVAGLDPDAVDRTIADAGGSVGQIDRHQLYVGAAEVVDPDGIGVAECLELDALDVIQRHTAAADVPADSGNSGREG